MGARIKIVLRAWTAVALGILLPGMAVAAVFNVGTAVELSNALVTASSNGQDDTINLAAVDYYLDGTMTYDATEAYSLTLQCLTNQAVLDGDGKHQCLYIFARDSSTNAFVTKAGYARNPVMFLPQ